jgi:isopenicillin N synthase-like dioxygenase
MLSIPVIELAPILNRDPHGERRVARAMRDACESVGFFYLAQHGVASGELGTMFMAARRFFAQPLQGRMRVQSIGGNNRGYKPVGWYRDQGATPDLYESFQYQQELQPGDPDIIASKQTHSCNQWPDSLPGWKETLLHYHDVMARLANSILRAFELALRLEDGFFSEFYRKPLSQVNLLHYIPNPPKHLGRAAGLRPHHDTSAFTILAQDAEGLQVEYGGRWIEVPPVAGMFVVNIGELMARWTNDRFVAAPHRVITRSARDRYSVVFFAIPDYDAVVSCLPTCQGPNDPPRYAPLCSFMFQSRVFRRHVWRQRHGLAALLH